MTIYVSFYEKKNIVNYWTKYFILYRRGKPKESKHRTIILKPNHTKSGIWQFLSIRFLCVLLFDFAMWLWTFRIDFPLSSVFLWFYFIVHPKSTKHIQYNYKLSNTNHININSIYFTKQIECSQSPKAYSKYRTYW